VRVFLDTNVLVSAFAARGLCAEVLELLLLDHDLIVGRKVLGELEKALREKVRLPAARSTEIVDFIAGEAAQVVDIAEPAGVSVDAADAIVMGEALAGNAELFVTGDAALLRLAVVGALRVVSPRQFWEVLRAGAV
jgi:putative PIN family toxin of toxin-antitoxin system